MKIVHMETFIRVVYLHCLQPTLENIQTFGNAQDLGREKRLEKMGYRQGD